LLTQVLKNGSGKVKRDTLPAYDLFWSHGATWQGGFRIRPDGEGRPWQAWA